MHSISPVMRLAKPIPRGITILRFRLVLCLAVCPRENLLRGRFQQRRNTVMNIYRTWNVSSVHQVSGEITTASGVFI